MPQPRNGSTTLSPPQPADSGAPWVRSDAELKSHGLPSVRTLRELRKDGHLKPGKHFYRQGRGTASDPIYFSVPRVREALLALSAQVETYDREVG